MRRQRPSTFGALAAAAASSLGLDATDASAYRLALERPGGRAASFLEALETVASGNVRRSAADTAPNPAEFPLRKTVVFFASIKMLSGLTAAPSGEGVFPAPRIVLESAARNLLTSSLRENATRRNSRTEFIAEPPHDTVTAGLFTFLSTSQ